MYNNSNIDHSNIMHETAHNITLVWKYQNSVQQNTEAIHILCMKWLKFSAMTP